MLPATSRRLFHRINAAQSTDRPYARWSSGRSDKLGCQGKQGSCIRHILRPRQEIGTVDL